MIIGQRVRRTDARDKVKGTALFVGDLPVAGVLEAGVLRSPHAHARILRLEVARARTTPGVLAVLTAKDIPGRNLIPLIQADWQVLAGEYVRHVGEAVALVAAESRRALADALGAIEIEYEPLEALLDMEQALATGEVMAHWRVRRGEAAVALTRGDLTVVEGVYRTPYQEHATLEPNGALAQPDGTGGMVLRGAFESPFLVREAVASVLGLDLNAVRVVQAVTGGGFGAKDEAAAAPAAQAALLAAASGRPVRLLLSRHEEMTATSKRHPARVRVRMGATDDGRLIAAEVDILLDGGAYATLTPLVLSEAAFHACGPYRVPNVRVDAKAVRTHKVPCGVFRGAGAIQAAFAFESGMDLLAERLGVDPIELRRRNALGAGDETITSQKLEASVGFREVLDKIEEASGWAQKREVFSRDDGAVRRGIGVAASHTGIGLGPIGRHLGPAAGASIVVSADASVTVAVGVADTGQGEATGLAQIAAEALGCPLEVVRVLETDTSRVPEGGPATGSRATVVCGNAVRDAAAKVRAAIDAAVADTSLPWRETVGIAVQRRAGLAAQGWAVPPETSFDLATGQGDAHMCYTFSACVAEVEVDTATGETRVVRVTSCHDVGRVVNPASAEGQVEGGVVLGLGHALLEEHAFHDGRIRNDSLSTYLVPTVLDAPEVRVVFIENPYPWGPWGAKGLADAPPVAVAPAVVAAIAHATGVRLQEIPATAERVWAALREKGTASRG
jgi:CO/xanthine dehydrogenase Mo-binding subunit